MTRWFWNICKSIGEFTQNMLGYKFYTIEMPWFDVGVSSLNKPWFRNNLLYRIRGLLRKSRADFEDRCYLELDEAECSPTYLNLPWTEIITACVAYQLCTLQPAANHKVSSFIHMIHTNDIIKSSLVGRSSTFIMVIFIFTC